jgi:hypothetical protein
MSRKLASEGGHEAALEVRTMIGLPFVDQVIK